MSGASPDAASHERQVETPSRAIANASSPHRESSAPPKDLRADMEYNRDNSRETVRAFRKSQIVALRGIAKGSQYSAERLRRPTPSGSRPATGTVQVAHLAHLAQFTQMRGTNRPMQFPMVAPMAGCLRQSGFPPMGPIIPDSFTDPDSILAPNAARSRARAPREISRHAKHLLGDAIAQVEAGWLAPPVPLD